MDGDQAANSLYLVLALMLVASSLIGMRLPVAKVAKMALAWVAIFGVGFILFSFRSEFSSFGSRLRAEALGTPIQAGDELRIPMAEGGHFWVSARINEQEARFLVDSGATVTTLSGDTAEQAGVEADMRIAMVETANGEVRMRVGTADRFAVGSIVRTDFTVHINDRDDENVLGMNFLSKLDSWRVEGNYLVLKP